jgi:TatD DNase family protein
MPIFDTHCHYNLEPLYSGQAFCFKIDKNDSLLNKNWQDHWLEAQKNDIKKTLIPGAGLSSSQLAVKIAKQDKNLYASVAVHPLRVEKIQLKKAINIIEKLAQEKTVVAIGETGLDFFYFSKKDKPDEIAAIKKAQEELFISQIQLAIKNKLTLIVHARDQGEEAYWRILEILKEHWPAKENIIFHCLSGPDNYIKEAMSIKNSYFGFDGNLTFKNANNLRKNFQLVQKEKPNRILLETDAPYLAPIPYRGQICEPAMISQLANFAKINLKADLDQIYQNSLFAFNLQNNLEKHND